MSSLSFGLFFVMLAVTAIFYVAGGSHGSVVVSEICLAGGTLCRHPGFLAVATAALGMLWLAARGLSR